MVGGRDCLSFAGFTPIFGGVRVSHLFDFLCCYYFVLFVRHVSCVPNVASFSGLSILPKDIS